MNLTSDWRVIAPYNPPRSVPALWSQGFDPLNFEASKEAHIAAAHNSQSRRHAMRSVVGVLGLLALATASSAQSSARPEILVIGTYHMSKPGRDIHNVEADDVLSPRRQQELAQLLAVLKRFQPTRIAVEAHVGSQRVKQQYADYLAGRYTLSRNEIDQIGYRLAKELGHQTVYPVDEDGEFLYYRVRNYAWANGLRERFDTIQTRTSVRVKQESDFLRTHTILETLEYTNSDSMVARAVAEYYAFVPLGEPFEYAGPDLLALWFQRNIRIYRNILALITSPGDRILVVYGAGHLGWLRQNVSNDATVQLRKLSELTRRP